MNHNKNNRRESVRNGNHTGIMVAIGDKRFQLNDISSEGIGIVVAGPDAFFLGQRIDSIHFTNMDADRTLNGIVSHITKNDQGFRCGIRFVFSGSRDFKFVKNLAQNLLEEH